jgi:GNAT superfamily N-acetyltransferase
MTQIRLMTDADLPHCLRLSQQAGWNQTAADWQRALDLQPDGCFVAEHDGVLVGTTTTCLFGSIAWIAMVLVEPALRRRGIGTALMHHVLALLDRQGVETIRLDATPLGQPIYERLGFVTEYRLARYAGTLAPAPVVQGVESAVPEQWQALAALDRLVSGADRRALLFRLFAEQPDGVRLTRDGDGPTGFMAARPGSQAMHLGPCIAPPHVSPLLFTDAWGRYPGQRVYVDIPLQNVAATRLAEAQGLTVQRYLTRMSRGAPQAEARLDWLWATFGPEKG